MRRKRFWRSSRRGPAEAVPTRTEERSAAGQFISRGTLRLEPQAAGGKQDQREDLWLQSSQRNINRVGARAEDAEDKVRWKRTIGCSPRWKTRGRNGKSDALDIESAPPPEGRREV